MARTRSDFLTRALSVGGDSEEDDYEGGDGGPRHYSLPISKQGATDAGLTKSCFSDSDMVTGAIRAISGRLYALFDVPNALLRESVALHHGLKLSFN